MATSTNIDKGSFYRSFSQNVQPSPNACQVPSYFANSNGVTDKQPHLKIIVQPCDKFRFRYHSESGSHGKVRGSEDSKSKTNFPTVKLHNMDSSHKNIEIKATLCTDEVPPRPHILELDGKNCRDDGGCWETLTGDTAIFCSLDIKSKRKDDAIKILMARKSRLAGRRQNDEQFRKEAIEEFKSFKSFMKRTVLCFQAFQNDRPIYEPVFSSGIENDSNATLNIAHISSYAGHCKGGEKIILLCNKIKTYKQGDIQIHFYETGENGSVIWKDVGKFDPISDVWYKVAIIFETPVYRNELGGKVFMKLYHPKDKKSSAPIDFVYKPEFDGLGNSKKRKLNFSEFIENGFGQAATSAGCSVPVDLMEDNYSPIIYPQPDESGNRSLPTSTGGDSPVDGELERNLEENYKLEGVENLIEEIPNPNVNSILANEEPPNDLRIDAAEPLDLYPGPTLEGEATGSAEFNNFEFPKLPQKPTIREEADEIEEYNASHYPIFSQSLNNVSQETEVTSYTIVQTSGKDGSLLGKIFTGFDYIGNLFSSREDDRELLHSSGPVWPSMVLNGLESGIKMVSSIFKPSRDANSNEAIPKSLPESAATNDSFQPADDRIYPQSGLIFDMNHLSIEDSDNFSMKSPFTVDPQISTVDADSDNVENRSYENRNELNRNFEHFKESINIIMKNRNEKVYLQYLSKLMSVTDEDGNSFLHLAVEEHNENSKLISIISKIYPHLVNKQNNFNETPLHLASKLNGYEAVLVLLSHGGNPSIVDAKGNNCFHITSESNFYKSLTILLLPSLKHGKHIPSIDYLNYEGCSPLHLAVLNNVKGCVNLLLRAGANVNIRDGKSGSSPLYLAMKQQSSLVQDLLSHPKIDLFNKNFHGDTFIHALCNLKSVAEPRNHQSTYLVNWARKTLALPSIDSEQASTAGSDSEELSSEDSDSYDNESDNENELETTDCRKYPFFAQPYLVTNHETSTAGSDSEKFSSETSDSDYNESDNGNETEATDCRQYKIFAQPYLAFNDVDENFLSEECEERLRTYLDDSSAWRQLGLFIGLEEKCLDGLARLSRNSSPSKVVLRKVKELYRNNYNKQTMSNILTEAGLQGALKTLD